MKLGLSLALILTAGPCQAETSPGIAYLADPTGIERPLALSIWYPSDEQASATIGGNAVFQGVAAAPDAPLPPGPLPLVVVSHGGLRSAADSGAWLGSSIARAGFLVVEVNAPFPDNAAESLDEIWRRPQDISRALDLMLGDTAWGARIDRNRISVAGFALGATAALSIAGADMDVEKYMQSCAADGAAAGPDCRWYAAEGVELTQTDREGLQRRMHDARFTSVIAIDPEHMAALRLPPETENSLLISLGDQDHAAGVPGIAQSVVIPEASTFDVFSACTKAGPGILLEEDGDAAICGGPAEARESIHRKVSEAVTTFLKGAANSPDE